MKYCLLLILLLPTLILAQSPLLPVDHSAYDFLERMETKGLLEHPLLGSKPVSRVRISALLDEVHEALAGQPDLLSSVDRDILSVLRWEFARDAERFAIDSPPAEHPDGETRIDWIHSGILEHGGFLGTFYRNGLNLYSYQSDKFDGYIDPRGMARVIQQEGDNRTIAITAVGIRLRGQIYDKLGIYFDFLDNTEQGRGPYWDRAQLYEDRTGWVPNMEGKEFANYDVSNFDMTFGGGFWELHLTKTPLRWGPGQSGQLLLSDWGTSFHQVQAGFNLGSHLRLVYVFGTLKTYPEVYDWLYNSAGYVRNIEADKYIAAHRLEWDPHPRFRIAFSETVIFGERNPELAFLIPVNFFHSAQHDLGDEDNSLLTFDATWIFHKGWRLYGELLVDDVSFNKLGTDFYGNKLGWLGGLSCVEPLGLDNLDATLEMVQLRPFIYTHQYPVNVYTHWTAPLGYRYGPNTETLFFDIRYRPHRRVALNLNLTRSLHGGNTASYNAGGNILEPHEHGTDEDAPFLGGALERMQGIEIGGEIELLMGLYIWSRGSWIDYDGDGFWEWEAGFRFN
ncbi:hypothetical protein CEE37_00090 [candidate division LCP-89 bacterium B3_LCP]|uniref:Capsule assembly Wzi family protein n=1 Tax=candidate division LCP-89 bacterium B3_LCP TaxID=2012998 RepID=A0A532V4Q2_UNCL8|nr:MAG: hypothetical protein CEE37_00090 [candidate division LCP-89 bacterium B3_LCP]